MRFFTPDTSFFTEYTDRGKYLLTWRLSLIFAIGFTFLSFALVAIHTVAFLIYFAALLIAVAGMVYLRKTKRYKHLFWSYSIGGSSLLIVSLFTEPDTIHVAEFVWVFSIVIFSFIGLNRKAGIFFLSLNTVALITHLLVFFTTDFPIRRPAWPFEAVGILVEIALGLFMTGYLLHQYLLFQAYAEKQLILANQELGEQNQIILKRNEENATLVKEIHHRVKNNLQIIISLLRMHGDEVRSKETKRHFAEAVNRIMSMSLIHQKLYQERELSTIDFDGYLRDLSGEIMASYGKEHKDSQCHFRSDVKRIGLQTVVPLGLLINELMTNSLKHAFGGSGEKEIFIRIQQLGENQLLLEFSDTGSWKAKPEDSEGFGLELIELLTQQLEGTFDRTGSSYRFELCNLDH
ncbi:MAG TPA: histidine kinase dimerization/phosphoacceptor domain -containing protein [Fluviicola sp.]|nr:histidine kinase dimerization/phosphoacceptor domain -containing protein [Fluviicola sp.]